MWDIIKINFVVLRANNIRSGRYKKRVGTLRQVVKSVAQQSAIQCVKQSRLKREGEKPGRPILCTYCFESAGVGTPVKTDCTRCVVLLSISEMIETESSAV